MATCLEAMNRISYSLSQDYILDEAKGGGRSRNAGFDTHFGWTDVLLVNRSPKGNMWSAMPVPLLCMVVNRKERKHGSGPEEDEVL